MTQAQDLLALAERVERLTGPSAEERQAVIDAYNLVFPHEMSLADEQKGDDDIRYSRTMHRVRFETYINTDYQRASLDAALMLVSDDAFWRIGHDGEGADPSLFKAQMLAPLHRIGNAIAIAETPALALTAAALRVRALAHASKAGGE